MPVTNPPEPGTDPIPPDPQEDWEQLHYLVTHLVEAAFTEPPQVVTTDRTGRVDGGWVADEDSEGHLRPVSLHRWLETTSEPTRDFTLRNLGGMLRLYASHPARNHLVTVTTYDEWPAMVEVHLYE